MRDHALVSAIEEEIWVIPLISDTCINCNTPCGKHGTPFKVANSAHIAIHEGGTVKLAAPRGAKITQGFFALLFPIFAAAAGYLGAPQIARAAGMIPGEGIKAIGVLGGIVLSAGIVLLVSRLLPKIARSEIIEALD